MKKYPKWPPAQTKKEGWVHKGPDNYLFAPRRCGKSTILTLSDWISFLATRGVTRAEFHIHHDYLEIFTPKTVSASTISDLDKLSPAATNRVFTKDVNPTRFLHKWKKREYRIFNHIQRISSSLVLEQAGRWVIVGEKTVPSKKPVMVYDMKTMLEYFGDPR